MKLILLLYILTYHKKNDDSKKRTFKDRYLLFYHDHVCQCFPVDSSGEVSN